MMIFIERPISAICIAIAVALMAYPVVAGIRKRKAAKNGPAEGTG